MVGSGLRGRSCASSGPKSSTYETDGWKLPWKIASPTTPIPEIIGTSSVDAKRTLRPEAAHVLASVLRIGINWVEP